MPRSKEAKDVSQDVKQRIVELIYNQGRKVKDVSQLFGIKLKTVYGILNRHKNSALDVPNKPRGGNKSTVILPEHLDFIDQCLTLDCTMTRARLTECLNAHFHLSVSESTITRTMSRVGYTLKLVKNVPYLINSPETIEQRYDYALWLSSITPRLIYSNLIFIDESGFNQGLKRKQGYNVKGFPAIDIPIKPKSSNVNIIGAMTGSKGVIHFETHFGNVNGEKIIQFVVSLIQTIITDQDSCGVDMDNPIYMVWDNASIHRARSVQENCFSEGITEIHGLRIVNKPLPPYSPFLNPIEEAWSHSKFDVRVSGINANDTLQERIATSMRNISPNLAQAYTDHMMRFLQACLQREPVINEKGTANQREMERYQMAQEAAGMRFREQQETIRQRRLARMRQRREQQQIERAARRRRIREERSRNRRNMVQQRQQRIDDIIELVVSQNE